jgi:hypothetical protein
MMGLSFPADASKEEKQNAIANKPKVLFVFMFVLNGASSKMVTLSAQIPVIFDKSGKNGILFRCFRKKWLNKTTWIGF